MTEHYTGEKTNGYLRQINKVTPPTVFKGFKEWKSELFGEYSAGFVIGTIVDGKNPSQATLYYDGGRRRSTATHKEGIILEQLNIPTERIIKLSVQAGDLVQVIYTLGQTDLKKLASREDFDKLGILVYPLAFDWEKVIGFTRS